MIKPIISVIFTLTLASCALKPVEPSASWQASVDYQATGARTPFGVYLYGGKTLIEMPAGNTSVTIRNKDGSLIRPEIIGKYARFDAKLDWFELESSGRRTVFTLITNSRHEKGNENSAADVTTYPLAKVNLRPMSAEDIQFVNLLNDSNNQLRQIQHDLDALQAEITQGRADLGVYYSRLANLRNRLAATSSAIVIVNFDFKSSKFVIDESTADQLIAAAKTAQNVIIRGRTDSLQATQGNIKIARQRAESARRFLVANGIPKKKISILSLPAGDLLLPNSSDDQKALNRRVEIEVTNYKFNELRSRLEMLPKQTRV